MLYQIKDKYGNTIHILKIKNCQMTKFRMTVAIKEYCRYACINVIADFDCQEFQEFLACNYGVSSKEMKFDVLNLEV